MSAQCTSNGCWLKSHKRTSAAKADSLCGVNVTAEAVTYHSCRVSRMLYRLFEDNRRMRRATIAVTVTLAAALAAHAEKARKPVPPQPAAQYPQKDAHTDEHVTIAAEPADIDSLRPDTRLDYSHHGFLPIRVIVTNDSDKPVTLDDARIHLITADSTVIQAATEEELQRRLFSRKYVSDSKIPMPYPIPSIPIHHKPVDKQILADEADFGFISTTVAPHSTAAGYLYYDVKQIDDPVLDHATLEVRRVHYADSGKDFYAYEIPLKPTTEPAKASPTVKRP